ncbi:MAG TPA: helix-hairpin-helix domain-containing protein [Gemmataceae bacterium]|jgi:competence ComEA-like helix-hairpin-helix protein
MDAAPSPVGVAAASPTPPPQWPAQSKWIEPPSDLSVRLPSTPEPGWSRPAQGAAVLLLLVALALLGWHGWSAQRWGCRPATLETDALHSPSLDLNQADCVQLMQLPGVGEALAQRIEAYRVGHHGFRSVDELRQVHGIGPKLLEKIRPHVFVEAPPSDEEDEPIAKDDRRVAVKAENEKNPFLASQKEPIAERIDLNHATAAELRRLPGVGTTLSQRIIEVRGEKLFRDVEDLRRVRGIGAKTLERLRSHVVVK